MKKFQKLALLLGACALLPARGALAGNSLLCVEQKKTGFALGSWSHEWEIAKFENYKRLVLRAPTDAERDAQPSRVWMVAPDGKVVAHFGSTVTPDSKSLNQAIEKLLQGAARP